MCMKVKSLLNIICDLDEKTNLNPSFQLKYEKPGKRFFLNFLKYCRVSENLSVNKNEMPLRLR